MTNTTTDEPTVGNPYVPGADDYRIASITGFATHYDIWIHPDHYGYFVTRHFDGPLSAGAGVRNVVYVADGGTPDDYASTLAYVSGCAVDDYRDAVGD